MSKDINVPLIGTTTTTTTTSPIVRADRSAEENRVAQPNDIVNLNSSSSTAQQPTTYSPSTVQTKPAIITFPKGENILDVEKLSIYKDQAPKLAHDNALFIVYNIGDLDVAIEAASEAHKNNPKDRDGLSRVIHTLLATYPKEQVVEKLKEAKLCTFLGSKDKLQFKLGPRVYPCTYTNPADERNTISKTYDQIRALENMFLVCSKNGKTPLVQEIIKKHLQFADIRLNLIKGTDREQSALHLTTSMLVVLKPLHQYNVINKLKHHFIKSEGAIVHIAYTLHFNNKTKELVEFLEPVIDEFRFKHVEHQADCFRQLGDAYNDSEQNTKALECYKKAYNLDATQLGLSLYKMFQCIPTEEKESFIQSIQNENLMKVLLLMSDYTMVTNTRLSQIDFSTLHEDFVLEVKPTLEIIGMINANQALDQPIDIKQKVSRKIYAIQNKAVGMGLALYCGFEDVAKKVLQSIAQKTIAATPFLRKYQTIFNSRNAASISEIQSYEIETSEKAALFLSAANASLADEGNSQAALNQVTEGLLLEPRNEDLAETGFAAALIANDKEKAKAFIEVLSNEKKIEIAPGYSKDDNGTENIEDLWENYDPVKIHQHHTMRKKQELSKISESIIPTESSWKIGGKKIKVSETIYIGKYRHLDCWAIIDDKLASKVDITPFERALKKGIVTREEGQNGTKFLGNNAIELKINGELRLYTNKIYLSNEGKLLINYDDYGNHNAASNFAEVNKITYISDS